MAKRVIGVSPGAAYGTAKRWLPERFAEAAAELAPHAAPPSRCSDRGERDLCEQVAQLSERAQGHKLCRPDHAGAIHRSGRALRAVPDERLRSDAYRFGAGVPTVAIFGATDDIATGPTGSNARVVRQPVECSPCLLRECPIDHRCMTRVSAERVVKEALQLSLPRGPAS